MKSLARIIDNDHESGEEGDRPILKVLPGELETSLDKSSTNERVQNILSDEAQQAGRVYTIEGIAKHVPLLARPVLKSKLKGYKFVDITDPESRIFKDAMEIYEYSFPESERQPVEEIILTIKWNNESPDEFHRFHSIVILDEQNRAVGYNQFSLMPVKPNNKDEALVYGEYIAIADEKFMNERYGEEKSRRKRKNYKATVALIPLIALSDIEEMGYEKLKGGFLESEIAGSGENAADIAFSYSRLKIHQNAVGSKAIMFVDKDGKILNPYMLPKISEETPPLQFLFLYKSLGMNSHKSLRMNSIDLEEATELMSAAHNCLEAAGLDKEWVDFARRFLQEQKSKAVKAVLVDPTKVPNICQLAKDDKHLADQIMRDYGHTISEHATAIEEALASKSTQKTRRKGL